MFARRIDPCPARFPTGARVTPRGRSPDGLQVATAAKISEIRFANGLVSQAGASEFVDGTQASLTRAARAIISVAFCRIVAAEPDMP